MNIDTVVYNDGGTDQEIEVRVRGTGNGLIVGTFASCDADIVGGGGTVMTYFYGHRIS